MNLQEMKVDLKASLTVNDKKNLMDIIDQEFNNKESLYHQIQEKEKEKILEQYKKDIDFPALKRKHQAIENKITKLQKQRDHTI